MEQVSRVAPLDRPVLVIGERGTGKELIAARLHYLSPRWDRPLVKLNAAAIPETLLESELFGHEAGAFTGAVRRRAGRFELAHGGSLFLDEIANTSLAVQERLLRVVEYGSFDRVGGSAPVQVDVRLIGATNVDLPAAAAAGRFRLDLLDRLAFDVLTVPPLRARRGRHPAARRELRPRDGARARPGALSGLRPERARRARRPTPGPATCASSRTWSSARSTAPPRPGRPIAELQFDPFASPFRPAAPPPSAPGLANRAVAGRPAARFPGRGRRLRAPAADRRARRLPPQSARDREPLGLTYDQLRNQLRKHGLLPGR